MLFLLVSDAFAIAKPWQAYAVSTVATAVSMPITYKSAQAIAGQSNQLVLGLLPSVLIGIATPATAAWVGNHWMHQKYQVEYNSWKTWGKMIGLNTIIWTSGTALGVTPNKPKGAFIYALATSLILPLPSLNTKHTLNILPSQSDSTNNSYLVQGSYSVSF